MKKFLIAAIIAVLVFSACGGAPKAQPAAAVEEEVQLDTDVDLEADEADEAAE